MRALAFAAALAAGASLAVAPGAGSAAASASASTNGSDTVDVYVESFGHEGDAVLRTIPQPIPDSVAQVPARGRLTAADSALHSVTAVLVNWPGLAKDSMTPAALTSTINDDVNSYWSDNTDGAVTFDVVDNAGWVTLASAPSDPCNNIYSLVSAVQSAISYTSTARSHLVIYAPHFSCGWAGIGTVGSGLSSSGWAVGNGYGDLPVLGHELGHNIGLQHSKRATCHDTPSTGVFDDVPANCTIADYYDLYDIMALDHTPDPGYLNPVHLQHLGLQSVLSPKTYTGAGSPQTFTLAPRSATSGTRGVTFVDGDTYWVEYRADAGRDSWLTTGTNAFHPGVVVRRMSGNYVSELLDASPVATGTPSFHDPVELAVGQTVTTQGGTTIRLDAQTASDATVTITSPDTTPPSVDAPLRARLVKGTLSGERVPVVLRWRISDAQSGLRTQTLQRGSAAPTKVGANRHTVRRKTPLGSLTWAVTGTDQAGNAATTQTTVRARRSSEGAGTFRGAWRVQSARTALDQRVRSSNRPGAVARYRFTGRSVAWVAPLGPGLGRAQVSVDGRAVATVSLRRSTAAAHRLVFTRSWAKSGRHTLTVTVVSGRVDVDGFAVLR